MLLVVTSSCRGLRFSNFPTLACFCIMQVTLHPVQAPLMKGTWQSGWCWCNVSSCKDSDTCMSMWYSYVMQHTHYWNKHEWIGYTKWKLNLRPCSNSCGDYHCLVPPDIHVLQGRVHAWCYLSWSAPQSWWPRKWIERSRELKVSCGSFLDSLLPHIWVVDVNSFA